MSGYRIAMKMGWEKDLVAQAELEGKEFYRHTERSRILQQRILGSPEDKHLLLSPHREKKKKENINPSKTERKGVTASLPCLLWAWPLLREASSKSCFLPQFFSLPSRLASFSSTHQKQEQTTRNSHTARNSTNDSTIPKTQGLEKHQLRIKVSRRENP